VLHGYAWLATLLLAFSTCKRSVTHPTIPVVATMVRFSHRPFYPSAGQARHPSAFQIDGFTERKKGGIRVEVKRASAAIRRVCARMFVCSNICL